MTESKFLNKPATLRALACSRASQDKDNSHFLGIKCGFSGSHQRDKGCVRIRADESTSSLNLWSNYGGKMHRFDSRHRTSADALYVLLRITLASAPTMSGLQFWKPGTQRPGSSVDRASEIEDVIIPSASGQTSLSIQSQREQLPIFKHS